MVSCNRVWSRANAESDCRTWKDTERARWLELFGSDDPELPRRWARETAYQNAGVYTRYLACVREQGLEPRLSADGLRLFIRKCEAAGAEGEGCVPRTIAGYIGALYKIGRLLSPEADLAWLMKSYLRAEAVAKRTPKLRNTRIVDAGELYLLGKRLVEEARRLGPGAGWAAIGRYRTGLFICFGLIGPERLRALQSLKLSDFADGCAFYGPEDIKVKRESVRAMTEEVEAMLWEWIADFRSIYEPHHDAVWIARGGAPAVPATLYIAMRQVTEAEFGVPVTPHILRNIAATFIKRHAPEKAAIIPIILGHSSDAVTPEYTQTAESIEAARIVGAIIDARRESLEREVRAVTRREIALSPRARRRRRYRNANRRRPTDAEL